MNHVRNVKIARLPDPLGEEGGGRMEDRLARGGTSRHARARGALQVAVTRVPIQAAGDGGAATPVRARPRALKLDFIPCRPPTQSTTTNGHPIAFSQSMALAATLEGCCGQGRPPAWRGFSNLRVHGTFLSRVPVRHATVLMPSPTIPNHISHCGANPTPTKK
jgi:hypothetical protein